MWWLVVVCVWLLVVGGTAPADTYEVALLNGCDLQDASQFIQVSQQQQQQLVLINNNILPISQYFHQSPFVCCLLFAMMWSGKKLHLDFSRQHSVIYFIFLRLQKVNEAFEVVLMKLIHGKAYVLVIGHVKIVIHPK